MNEHLLLYLLRAVDVEKIDGLGAGAGTELVDQSQVLRPNKRATATRTIDDVEVRRRFDVGFTVG